MKDISGCESPREELAAALQAGKVIPGNGGGYWCNLCEQRYASKATIKAHLSTKKHCDKASPTPPHHVLPCTDTSCISQHYSHLKMTLLPTPLEYTLTQPT